MPEKKKRLLDPTHHYDEGISRFDRWNYCQKIAQDIYRSECPSENLPVVRETILKMFTRSLGFGKTPDIKI